MGTFRLTRRRKIIFTVSTVIFFFLIILIVLNQLIAPVVRSRLKTFIIEGSDSLYTYSLGDLEAHILGGRVEVQNLQIKIDSNHYRDLEVHNQLPSITMQLNLKKGTINGIDLLSLIFSKKIHIDKIRSKEANITLSRHPRVQSHTEWNAPIWKSIQHDIRKVSVDEIRLDGLKLLYRHADTAESAKLQFDKCDAVFKDVDIDSVSAADPERVAYSKDIDIAFEDMKFRTSDSSYKMKATGIRYSTGRKILEVDSFKCQPTLEKEDFYRLSQHQTELFYLQLEKFTLVNARLDDLINKEMLKGDSMLFQNPVIQVYADLSARYPDFESNVGKYPHQLLLSVPIGIDIVRAIIKNGRVSYTQKSAAGEEGTVSASDINMQVANITNLAGNIKKDSVCEASATGMALQKSPFELSLKFFLNARNGNFQATGHVKNISSGQINPVSEPLAKFFLNSLFIHDISFKVSGENGHAVSDVKMLYNDLFLTIKKVDTATGTHSTSLFATKILNKLALRHNNPENGYEKDARGINVIRVSSQSFFGFLWKAVFSGIQSIIMNAP
ncbi:MAG: hypothetical protein ACJ75F_07560 [Flavisolibacter sp.]|jgi:hypothetical protein